ncbi:proline--tRNA ligase [Candidatus Shapirobacteria bacterium RBG_13_44_7]|uniref:Proline--tRNA ligase n=1 Tax=Candidatus Shapirobacteria bacterium RBG_13_44_7 TaxID=1802149 RepID=A0A1F7SKU4_9BACT|nr:MAG: proline--tRNA ligase [Candidatus Shapirobacteria bacterium RBG_13_44_7]
MLYSKLFGKTTKTTSSQAIAPSHKLLLQAGFIRPLSAGRYTILPLGLRVCKKIENIIRQEVDKTGAQELIVPTLHPIELWQQASRDQKFGAAMMRVADRNGAEFILGPTGEVVMLDLVKQFAPSYRDLPINIYQFSQKFRDEARPSGGLLRTREFVMKDAYSFHPDEEDLKKTYQLYWLAYENIAKALDIDTFPVESDNGAIGGSISHEFMVETPVGEDSIARCSCGYAANLETAEFIRDNINLDEEIKPFEIVSQPEWVETMEDNIKHYGQPKSHYLKNVVYKDVDGTIIIAVIRGDLSVNPAKLAKLHQAKGELVPATDADLESIGTRPGWVHCWGHQAIYVGDLSLKTVHNFIGGQKEKDTDSINVNYGRDFECQIFGDIAEAREGDLCPRCQKEKLKLTKCVEFGNIFNIGYTYSDPMDGFFAAQDGTQKKLYMGSYGIGIGRAMAVVVETHHDNLGIIWPKSIAPYHYHLIGLDLSDNNVLQKAQEIYQKLSQKYEVLFDDRPNTTPGEKFADADLIGIPLRLVVSQKSLAAGGIEFKERSDSSTKILTLDQLLTAVY